MFFPSTFVLQFPYTKEYKQPGFREVSWTVPFILQVACQEGRSEEVSKARDKFIYPVKSLRSSAIRTAVYVLLSPQKIKVYFFTTSPIRMSAPSHSYISNVDFIDRMKHPPWFFPLPIPFLFLLSAQSQIRFVRSCLGKQWKMLVSDSKSTWGLVPGKCGKVFRAYVWFGAWLCP